MYIVYANNHFGTVSQEWYILEKKYAIDTFNNAARCIDCASAQLVDGMTGEVLLEYEYAKEIKHYW